MLDNQSITNLLLALSIVINIITLILVIVSLKKHKSLKSFVTEYQGTPGQGDEAFGNGLTRKKSQTGGLAESGVVFCRNCGNQYDSAESTCPSCNTARSRG